MSDDVTNPAPDAEGAPEPEVIVAELETEVEEPEEEYSEVEREGKKYRIPKALEPELLMQSDYTKKTQTLAEQRKAFEVQESQLKQRAELQEVFAEDLGKLYAVKSQLQGYSKLDWQELERTNPAEAQRLFRQYSMLKDHAQGLENDLSQRQQQRQFEEQQELAKRIEHGRAELAREIPGWNDQKARELLDYGAKSFGFQPEELSRITDPRAVKVLHYAKIGMEAMNKARTSQQPQQQAAPVTQLATKRTAPTSDLYRIKDPEKWAEERNRQIAKKRSSR